MVPSIGAADPARSGIVNRIHALRPAGKAPHFETRRSVEMSTRVRGGWAAAPRCGVGAAVGERIDHGPFPLEGGARERGLAAVVGAVGVGASP